MAKLLRISLFAALALSAVSCAQECVSCSYPQFNASTQRNDTLYYPEACGSKKDMDAYESNCKADGATKGRTVTCLRDKKNN